MARFGLNIRELEDNIEKYRRYKGSAEENAVTCYECLANLDYAWIDNNSESFKSMINKDKVKLTEYFKYLDSFYNELETFKNNIFDILSRYGYSRSTNINYSSSRIQECLNYLGYAIGYLNNAVQYIGDIVYPSDFSELELVNELLNHLAWIRDDIDNYDDNICNLSNSILSELDESRRRKSRISSYDSSFKEHVYNWSNVHMEDYKLNNNTEIDDKKIGKNVETVSVNAAKNNNYANIDVNESNNELDESNIIVDDNKSYSQIDVKEEDSDVEDVVLNPEENTKYSEFEFETEGSYNQDSRMDINNNKEYSNFENQKEGIGFNNTKFSIDDEEGFSNISNSVASKYEQDITKIDTEDVFKNSDTLSTKSNFNNDESMITIKNSPEFNTKNLTSDDITNASEPISVKTSSSILDNKKFTSLDDIVNKN